MRLLIAFVCQFLASTAILLLDLSPVWIIPVMLVIVLLCSRIPRRRSRKPAEVTSKGFVAWYIQPYGTRRQYIREYPAGNIAQEYYSAGQESVISISQATVYPTEEAARAVLPVYDGSNNIGARTGVAAV